MPDKRPAWVEGFDDAASPYDLGYRRAALGQSRQAPCWFEDESDYAAYLEGYNDEKELHDV